MKIALISGALFLSSPAARASGSTSASFNNSRSAVDSGGGTMNSSGFQSIVAVGEIATTTRTSASYMARSGLIPIYFMPGQVQNFAVNSCASSQLTLSWIAPGNDGYGPGTAARSYMIKVSADPALSPAASETLFYQAADVTPAAPAPTVSGSTQSLIVTGLTDGVTYYFAILALEADLNPGALSAGATSQEGGSSPAIEGFVGVTGFRRSLLSWQAAAGVPGLCTPVAYRIYRSTTQGQDFVALANTPAVALTDLAVTAAATYYYQLVGLNSSNFEITVPTETFVYVRTAQPTPPLDIALSAFASSATITWRKPVAFDIGVAFVDPALPEGDELSGYRVWKSTSLFHPTWTLLATVSTDTAASYTDSSALPGDFYRVTAVNITETSQTSLILDYNQSGGYALSPDGRSHVHVPVNTLASLTPGPSVGYWMRSSSVTLAGTTNSPVLNSAKYEVLNQDGTLVPAFRFGKSIDVRMSFNTAADGSILAQASPGPMPDQAGLYWFNGIKYVKMYGRLDAAGQFMNVQNEMPGDYQLRGLTRDAAGTFDVSGLSNRFVTPNNDGKNDSVVFTFDNPADTHVSGKIFNLKGALVATLVQKTQFTMEWNGKSGGVAVPGGIYIYQIEGAGSATNGTVVVIK